MQSRPSSAGHQPGWGNQPNGYGPTLPLSGLSNTPWGQSSTAQWGAPAAQPGMPTLRSIMQEEQQAALQGHHAAPHSMTGVSNSRHGSAGNSQHDSGPQFMPLSNVPNSAQQYQATQSHLQHQQPPPQQQRSGGFYMNSKRDDSVPVKGSWAQALASRPAGEASNSLHGTSGFGNGLVDLQMATEAFRDAFSATAPAMDWPQDDQDPLLAEARKSPAHPITGIDHATVCGCSDDGHNHSLDCAQQQSSACFSFQMHSAMIMCVP